MHFEIVPIPPGAARPVISAEPAVVHGNFGGALVRCESSHVLCESFGMDSVRFCSRNDTGVDIKGQRCSVRREARHFERERFSEILRARLAHLDFVGL